jgi:hypothetical protein
MARWWLILALGTVAACDSGNLGDDGLPEGEGTCDGNAFTLRIDGLSVAASSTGFDLDGHDTQDTNDPVGCGKLDATGGVDNALAGLEATLTSYGFGIGGPLADAVSQGDVVIDITVAGYDGGETDDCVLVDITVNQEVVATSIESAVTGGVLDLQVPELPLQGEIDMGYGPMPVDITARAVKLALPLAGSPVSVTNGLMGAGLPWDEPANDADLRSLVEASVDPTWFPLVEGIMVQQLDLQPVGADASASCDAISAALVVDATSL